MPRFKIKYRIWKCEAENDDGGRCGAINEDRVDSPGVVCATCGKFSLWANVHIVSETIDHEDKETWLD